MSAPPKDVLRLAEDLNSYMPLRRGDRRLETDRYVLFLSSMPGPHGTVVQHLRLAEDEVEATVAEVREILRAEKRPAATWEIGPSARPRDLIARLAALGMRPSTPALSTGMVLSAPPHFTDDASNAVRVQAVATLDDFRRSQEILWQCFDFVPDAMALSTIERDFAALKRSTNWLRYLAFIDDRAVASADLSIADAAVILGGGATLPAARQKGVYRALIRARWQEAERRGIPHLVVQAGDMSRPILHRLGFVEVAAVQILLDESY